MLHGAMRHNADTMKTKKQGVPKTPNQRQIHTKHEIKDLQTEQGIHNFIQDKLEQSKRKQNKSISDNEIPINSHTTPKTMCFENHSLLSYADKL